MIGDKQHSMRGFTLIELSIVLVIIGLIVGGVLVGRDLISAAAVRAQISQMEKLQAATNTFRGKYAYLPGDIPDPDATKFGFSARGTVAGQGDGNGALQGNPLSSNPLGWEQCSGEPVMFWVDLSTVRLIDGSFSSANQTTRPTSDISGTGIDAYLPAAKMGNGNYIYAYSYENWTGLSWANTGKNFFGLSKVSTIGCSSNGVITSSTGLTVAQAASIDRKMDDGLPTSGGVVARYLSYWITTNWWAAGAGNRGPSTTSTDDYYGPSTAATAASSTTCFDNNNIAGTMNYSVSQNNGTGVNCALSFKMQ